MLLKALQQLTQSNIQLQASNAKLIASIDSLANSVNDFSVIIENADEMMEGMPPGYKAN